MQKAEKRDRALSGYWCYAPIGWSGETSHYLFKVKCAENIGDVQAGDYLSEHQVKALKESEEGCDILIVTIEKE